MNGETLKMATPMPFTTLMEMPAAKPPSMPRMMASQTMSGMAVKAAAMVMAPTTDVSARMVPTDRSKPPVRSASIWPIATMAR